MTSAFLGGKPLLDGLISWPLREGTKPVIQEFEMIPADAQAIVSAGGPITLNITPDQGNPVVVTNLWPISLEPGDDPFLSKLRVADRRYWLTYGHIIRRMNMRRNVGTKRLIANNLQAAVNPTAFQVSYWPWSLNNGVIWTPLDMLRDVLGSAGDPEFNSFGSRPPITMDDSINKLLKALPLENFVLDDSGDNALARALSYVPEGMFYVDYDGTFVVTSRANGGERGVLQALMPEIEGEGHVDLVKNNLIRPRAIEVLYTREVELVFDFTESGSVSITSGDTVTWPAAVSDTRVMENVLPSPDYQTTVNGQTISQGTWITFDQAFLAWGPLPSVSRSGGQGVYLGHDILQKVFVPGMDGWGMLRIAGNQPDNSGVTKPWMGRYTACQANYRTTFRLSPKYMDRILQLHAYRVATIDPQSGQRAPAAAYGDYCVLYTQQTLLKQARFANTQDGSPDWITNKTAYPASGVLDATAEVSPATVTIVDEDQGIIHIDYKPDPIFGMDETILPSQMYAGTLPTADISNRSRPISFDSVIGNRNPPRLSPSFQLKVILSGIPAAPNTIQQLHKITINPPDIATMLPDAAQAGLSDARGPIMQIRIGPQIEVARVQWLDSASAEIDKCFGLGTGAPNLTGLVINEGANSDLVNGASLTAIAKASAARLYASLCDRFQGSMSGYMNGQVRPNGWIPEVMHQLQPDGVAMTTVAPPSQIPQFDIFSWLNSSARMAIMHLARPQ